MNLHQLWAKVYSRLNSVPALKPAMLSMKDFYHARAAQRRKTFYSHFLRPGDVCFDIGANVGNRIDVFLQLGCAVIAAEPQTQCFDYLKKKYARTKDVILLKTALAEKEGSKELFVCTADAISSMSKSWISAVKKDRYKNFEWNKTEHVETTTLDRLIKTYGVPRFCKIDVEGFELSVLKGLSQKIPLISFEYSPEHIEPALKCIRHLSHLGSALFNYSFEEEMKFQREQWLTAAEMIEALTALQHAAPGDIYAMFGDMQ